MSGTWHDEVETFKEYSQTAMSNTASLSTLAKNGWLQRKKTFVNDNHFESLLALKCQSLFSFTFFFHFSLLKKTTFCKAVFIVTKTPSSDLLWFETHLLNKKGGKIWMKIPQLPHVMILLFDYYFYNNKVLFSLHCCDIIRRLKMLTCNFFNGREVLQMKFFFQLPYGYIIRVFVCTEQNYGKNTIFGLITSTQLKCWSTLIINKSKFDPKIDSVYLISFL